MLGFKSPVYVSTDITYSASMGDFVNAGAFNIYIPESSKTKAQINADLSGRPYITNSQGSIIPAGWNILNAITPDWQWGAGIYASCRTYVGEPEIAPSVIMRKLFKIRKDLSQYWNNSKYHSIYVSVSNHRFFGRRTDGTDAFLGSYSIDGTKPTTYNPVAIFASPANTFMIGDNWPANSQDWYGNPRILIKAADGYCLASFSATQDYNGSLRVEYNNIDANLADLLEELNPQPVDPGDDPLAPGGTSETGGGDGTFTSESDPLDFPDAPDLSAAATGMMSLFSPTNAQLQSLANYLWSTDFDLDLFKKMFSDPMAAIIGLSIVPVTVPTSGAVAVKFGGFVTTVSMNKASGQYVDVNCGSVSIPKYWGNALDYNPYTKIAVYLPYVGTHDLDTDEVIGKTLTIKYRIDILSGACLAMIKCGDAVLYQFAGSCSSQVPVSNRDWSNVISGAVSFGASAIAMAATGGASSIMTGALAVNAANSVMSSKVNVSHSGSIGGSAGMLGTQTPYLIIKRARQSLPEKLNSFEGYPSNITEKIINLTGFTQIESIHLETIPATLSELSELEAILKEGIII